MTRIILSQFCPIVKIKKFQEQEKLYRYRTKMCGTPDSSAIPKISLVTRETIRPYRKATPRKITRRDHQPGNSKSLNKTMEKYATDDLSTRNSQKNDC